MNYKTMILPIISLAAMAYQLATGVHIPEDVLNQAAFAIGNVVAVGVTLWGIIKSHKEA